MGRGHEDIIIVSHDWSKIVNISCEPQSRDIIFDTRGRDKIVNSFVGRDHEDFIIVTYNHSKLKICLSILCGPLLFAALGRGLVSLLVNPALAINDFINPYKK